MRDDIGFAAWHNACDTRDRRYDGVFYVALTSTRIYCRPVCPSRTARPERRRFFLSAKDAERAGYRSCKRCRPDLPRGLAPVDAVARLASKATWRIARGALNTGSVRSLAAELKVSERQLRRALERELGVSPKDLAQARRLSRARALLTQTSKPVTQVAYASGFQSVRRFNAAFRERFRMSPSDVRRQSVALTGA